MREGEPAHTMLDQEDCPREIGQSGRDEAKGSLWLDAISPD